MPHKPVDFGILLGSAYAAFVEDLRQHVQDHGHPSLHRWFGYVARALDEQPLNVRQLAEHLRMTPAGAVKVIDELVADGYVERVADEHDGRVRRVRLTRRGRDALAEARRFHRRFEEDLAAELGPRRVATVRAVLTELIVNRQGGEPAAAALRPI